VTAAIAAIFAGTLLPRHSGIAAVCRALFSKLLYLTEHEPLVAQGSEAFKVADLRTVSS
jgi:hypothetical protein